MTDRDAAPATAEGADDACTARMDAIGFIGITTRALYRTGWVDALAWQAARPASPATAGEALADPWQIVAEQWVAAHDDRCTNMGDCGSFGGEKDCHWPRPSMFAAREAARGAGEG